MNFDVFIQEFLELKKTQKRSISVEDTILQVLIRKKYRKKSLGEESKKDIFQRIKKQVQEQKPIHIIIPFGGFKHFWNTSAPKTNRAEFFHMLNMINYTRDICECYTPGIIIEYLSEDFIVPYMNNYKQEDMNSYHESFQQLIDMIRKYFPVNFKLKYSRVSDMCDHEKVYKRVVEILSDKKEWWASLSNEEKINNLTRSVRSVITEKNVSFSSIDINDTENVIVKSRLMELAYYDAECETECIGTYFFDDNKILALFSFGTTADNIWDNLTLGSLYNSVVDFRIGAGILQKNHNKYIPRIVSKTQREKLEPQLYKIETGIDHVVYKDIMCYDGAIIF